MATKLGEAYVAITGRDMGLRTALGRAQVDTRAATSTMGSRISAFVKSLKGMGVTMAIGIGSAVAGTAVAVGKAAFDAAADFDSLKRGLVAVAGSSEEAERQLVRLREVAKLPGLGYEEAIQGSVNLQAAGLSAELAEGALMGFGNALVTVGKGKAELDGVIVALSQIQSKGKVSAEEINQLAERVPQIRKVMQDAFGTSNTETLQKRGIKSEEFITAIVASLKELPRAQGGIKSSLENLQDNIKITLARIGDTFAPLVQKLADTISKFMDSADFEAMLSGLTRWVAQMKKDMMPLFKDMMASIKQMYQAIKDVWPQLKALFEVFVGGIVGGKVMEIAAILKLIGVGLAAIAVVINTVETAVNRLISTVREMIDWFARLFNTAPPRRTLLNTLLDVSIAQLNPVLEWAKRYVAELNKIKSANAGAIAATVEASEDEAAAVLDVVRAKREDAQAEIDRQRAAVGFKSIRDVGRSAVVAGMQERFGGKMPELNSANLPSVQALRDIQGMLKAQKEMEERILMQIRDALSYVPAR